MPPPNPWLAHVAQYRAHTGCTYKEALVGASATYHGCAAKHTYRSALGSYSHSRKATEDFVALLHKVKATKTFTPKLAKMIEEYVTNMQSSSSIASSAKAISAGMTAGALVGGAISGLIGSALVGPGWTVGAAQLDALKKLVTNTPQILCYHNLLVLLCFAQNCHLLSQRCKFRDIDKLTEYVQLQAKKLRDDLKSWFKPPISFAKNTYAAWIKMPVYEREIDSFTKSKSEVEMPIRVSWVNSSPEEREMLKFLIDQEPMVQLRPSITYKLARRKESRRR